jgi:hypothetical protein
MKDWADEGDVVEVHATQERVIDQNAIAGLEAFRAIGGSRLRHDMRQRAQMRRLREGLGNGAQLAIEKDAGEIATGFDIGRIGRAPQGRAHFLGDRQECMANHLEPHRVDVRDSRADRTCGCLQRHARCHEVTSSRKEVQR